MSEAAKQALVNASSTAIGTQINCGTMTYGELKDAGLVGGNFGLTRKGSIEAIKAKREAEDRAFG